MNTTTNKSTHIDRTNDIVFRGSKLPERLHRNRISDMFAAAEVLDEYAYANENGAHERVCGLMDEADLQTLREASYIIESAAFQLHKELDAITGRRERRAEQEPYNPVCPF